MEAEHVKKSPDDKDEDHGKINPEEKPQDHVSSSSSSVSSSAFSSSHDFDIDMKEQNSSSEALVEDDNLPTSYPSPDATNGQTSKWSMVSASPDNAIMHSPLSHPSTYDYDPNHIPMSIFSPKPANASEWSVASNESLFSIHKGNDYPSIMFKSGELSRLEGKNSSELSSLPTVMEVHEEGGVRPGKNYRVDNGGKKDNKVDDTSTRRTIIIAAKRIRLILAFPRVSDSRLSDESGNSNGSFAFPVLVSDADNKNSSLKDVPEKQQLEGQYNTSSNSPKASSSSSMTRWCSWFCWCPRCS